MRNLNAKSDATVSGDKVERPCAFTQFRRDIPSQEPFFTTRASEQIYSLFDCLVSPYPFSDVLKEPSETATISEADSQKFMKEEKCLTLKTTGSEC